MKGAAYKAPDGAIDIRVAVEESVDYLAKRARMRLETAAFEWRNSLDGPTVPRIEAWRRLEALREEFEAGQEET